MIDLYSGLTPQASIFCVFFSLLVWSTHCYTDYISCILGDELYIQDLESLY